LSHARSAFDETLSHHKDHEGFEFCAVKLRALRVLRGEIYIFLLVAAQPRNPHSSQLGLLSADLGEFL
jgi:hypothetical protein